MTARRLRLGGLLAAGLLAACSSPDGDAPAPDAPAVEAEVARAPDASAGRALLARYECHRCHEGTGLDAPPAERRCVGCHQDILAGRFDAPARDVRRWQRALTSLNEAPSLAHLGGHLRASWIAGFLQRPHDLRPGLPATMPVLGIGPEDAADLAAALTAGGPAIEEPPPQAPDVDAGRALLGDRGCLACHAFTGVAEGAPENAPALAPDLRFTRDRMTRGMLLRWLASPSTARPGTPMPDVPLTDAERTRLADAILEAPLAPAAPPAVPARLRVLERPVSFTEVRDRVLSRTCWHCHADPDFARGDGGPGNTGGFGYPGRGVSLLDYAGASSGYLDDEGERRSLYADDGGTPHLVRVLMARHRELAGDPDPGVTGMPLGLPPLPLEDIQLVESWIAQGRPNE